MEPALSKKIERFVSAYRKARRQQEWTEIELNRSKVVIFSEKGRQKMAPLLREH